MTQELINRGLILTDRGKQILENAQVTQQDIVLSKFGVGSGGDAPFNPTLEEIKAYTSVPQEWDKRSLEDAVSLPEGGVKISGLIPHNIGEGEWLRIFGIYTENDDLIYVFLHPEWKKPASGGNSFYEIPWSATTGVSDTENFKLVVNPSIVTASQAFVLEQDKKHVDDEHPHLQYQLAVQHTINEQIPIKLNQNNVFEQHLSVPLPVVDDGLWFDAKVHHSVDLDAGKCAFVAPNGEVIAMADDHHSSVEFISTNETFRFKRINNKWWV